MEDTICASSDPIAQCAQILRNTLLKVDFGLQDKFCDSTQLEYSMTTTQMPHPVQRFFL